MHRIALFIALITVALAPQLRADDKPAADKPAASQPAASQPAATLEASDTDALKAAAGKDVIVHGTVSRAGWYQDKILFINFDGVDRTGFAAIVRSADKDAVKDFGEGAADLNGKEVNITGKIKIYRDKPEIEITKAEQIKVLAGAPDADKDKDKKPADGDKKEEPQKGERS